MTSARLVGLPTTVAGAFEAAAAEFPNNDFLQVLPETADALGVTARTWSYSQSAIEVGRLRETYASAGYGHGHRAGLLLLNRPEFLFHFIALNQLGVSVVPINADWRAAELEFLIAQSEIDVACCIPGREQSLAEAARVVGRELVLTRPDAVGLRAAPSSPPKSSLTPDANTECALLYTSGTTGTPKGCVLPNEYFLYAGRWYNTVGGLCDVRRGVERMITPLPLTHMNAMAVSTMCMMLSGGCLIFLDRFHPASWWDSVRWSRATIVHYLGVMPAMLLGMAPCESETTHRVRFGFGAGVNPLHHAAFEERFGFPLIEAWAMTETGSGAVMVANHEPRHVGTACFGAAEQDVECRVVADSGQDAGADEPGELLVRHAGPDPRFGFFREYLKDEEATAAAWDGGWFHTGDLVRRDAQGLFRFVDRKKNVIRRSGENISAVEVESVLAQHPSVRAVGVCAVPDPVRGDEVFACIVLNTNAASQHDVAADLLIYCRQRLAYYKAPGYFTFCDVLPLTPTAKIQRSRLKQLAIERLETGKGIDVRSMKRRNGE